MGLHFHQNLLLSLFPGIDLFGRAFDLEGYHVVRGPDLLYGQTIEGYHVPRDVFEGIIGGSPCQDFSRARRSAPTGNGAFLLGEFVRAVLEARPDWWILENVVGVPDVSIDGYTVQRFNLTAAECGMTQRRRRRFQYGSRDAAPLILDRDVTPGGGSQPCCLASERSRPGRRDFSTFCELQGLPADFDLPGLSLTAKYRAVGNGVPIPMGRVIARAIKLRAWNVDRRLCPCECGRVIEGMQLSASPACRKRLERRRRDTAAVTGPGDVTREASQH